MACIITAPYKLGIVRYLQASRGPSLCLVVNSVWGFLCLCADLQSDAVSFSWGLGKLLLWSKTGYCTTDYTPKQLSAWVSLLGSRGWLCIEAAVTHIHHGVLEPPGQRFSTCTAGATPGGTAET
jgi:hypothetical protein